MTEIVVGRTWNLFLHKPLEELPEMPEAPPESDGSSCEAGQMAEYVYRVHGELVEGLDRVRGFEAKSFETLRYGLDTS